MRWSIVLKIETRFSENPCIYYGKEFLMHLHPGTGLGRCLGMGCVEFSIPYLQRPMSGFEVHVVMFTHHFLVLCNY